MTTPPNAPAAERSRTLHTLADGTLDVLVIGGGITGAGVARDAAMRGLRVGLVERDDLAAGTSSRSSRLIHGGVRYLEYGHVGLVFESSRERRILLRSAPHLVRPLAFTWPVYRGARVPRWKLEAGLVLYDALALFRNVANHRPLGRVGILECEPALRDADLRGGAAYWDASTDDARLVLANAVAARDAGATIVTHAEARALQFDGYGVRVRIADLLGGAEVVAQARVVVNAAGPWSDAVRALADAGTPAHVLGSKGVHVSVPAERLGNRGAVTLLSPTDGRVMFVLPGGTQSIIGTTETPAERGPDQVRATERDVAYLLASANAFFPAARLTRDDVTAAWAGIRPLAASRTSASRGTLSASREHTIERDPRGLITVTGGKLTTYRAMAAQIVDAVGKALGRRLGAAATDRTLLPGGDGDPAALIALATTTTGNPAIANRLVRAHGTAWRAVWDLTVADRSLAEPVVAGRPYVGAEFVYAVRHELAFTLADLLIRRVPLAYETSDHAASIAPRVASLVAPILGWSAEDRERALGSYDAETRRIFGVDA